MTFAQLSCQFQNINAKKMLTNVYKLYIVHRYMCIPYIDMYSIYNIYIIYLRIYLVQLRKLE